MKILLIIPQNKKGLLPLIPLGLMYIGTNLYKNGIEYDFFDLNFSDYNSLVQKLEQFRPDLVGITIRNIAETKEMNNIYQDIRHIVGIAQKYSKVILGGAGFSIFPNEIMHMTKAEYGVVGPGETAIVHIIKNLNKLPIGSIISKYDESFISSDISETMRRYWNKYGKYFILSETAIPIQTTRGCEFSCRYCTYPYLSGYTVQRRPIELIITEIRNIIDFTKRNSFYFVDSVFNMDIKYTKELLKGIINSGLRFQWNCCINPINYDDEMIELMKKSGCDHSEAGIDSFSDKQLETMNKNVNSNQAKDLLERLEKFNLSYSVSLILGGFGETEQTLSETYNIAESFKNAKINAFIGERIYPKTPLAKILNASRSQLHMADSNSIYIEGAIVPLLKSIIQNASLERWSFTGELPKE